MRQAKKRNNLHTAALAGLFGGALLAGVYRGQEGTTEPVNIATPLVTAASALLPASSTSEAWDVSNLDHERVDYWIKRFTTDKRDQFGTYLARSGRYEDLILGALAERNMPKDLFYLAMMESGFNPKAYSSAHASGIWQFISETGRRYGLEINRAVDERNDPVKSTEAALSYLSDLHDRFGSWYLAAASYNTGENRVGRIMREETGSERGSDADYYAIWDRLPRETRDYVPLMIAAGRISKDPASYGFEHIEKQEPLEYVEKKFAPATPLSKIAQSVGTTVDVIRRLNPEMKLNRTRNDMASVVRVPDSEA